jgi:hypothetical protein
MIAAAFLVSFSLKRNATTEARVPITVAIPAKNQPASPDALSSIISFPFIFHHHGNRLG